MRKFLKWMGIVALTPIVLFIFLLVLLYIPPIQNFVVGRVTAVASEKTGMKIDIDRLTLSFPLDLVIKGVEVISSKDTLLSVDRLQVNIQLLPLLRKNIEVDGIELKHAKVNSLELIKGMTIQGVLGELYIESHGVDLGTEEALINKALLKNTHLRLSLNDTTKTPRDSTSNSFLWKFSLRKLDLQNVSFAMQMPEDSLNLFVSIGGAALKNGHVDLGKQAYRLDNIEIEKGLFQYSFGKGEIKKGFDPTHLVLRDMSLSLDSLKYQGKEMAAIIHQLSLRERSGLEIVSLKGNLKSDTTSISVPGISLETPYSMMRLSAMMDWSAMMGKANTGAVSANLTASIGRQDVMLFAGGLPQEFQRSYPLRPLIVRTSVSGNMQRLNLDELKCELPGSFSFSASGNVQLLSDSLKRSGEIDFNMKTGSLDFILSMLDVSQRKRLAVPHGMLLDGKGKLSGSRYGVNMSLADADGKLTLLGMFNNMKKSYEAELFVDKLQLNHFLPKDSLGTLSASLSARGQGFDFLSSQTVLSANVSVLDFHYARYNLSDLHLDASLSKSVASVTLQSDNPLFSLDAKLDAWLSKHSIRANLDLNVLNIDWYKLRLTQEPLSTSLKFSIEGETDLKKIYRLAGGLTDLHLISPQKIYSPKDLYFFAFTDKDSTRADIHSGDLDIMLRAGSDLDKLIKESGNFFSELMRQIDNKKIEQNELKEILPDSYLSVSVGKDNPLSNYLAMSSQIGFGVFSLNLNTSPLNGMNGDAVMYSLHKDSLQLDTIRISIRQDLLGVKLLTSVVNVPGNNQIVFSAMAELSVFDNNAELLLKYLNEKGETGVLLGIKAALEDNGIKFHFFPEKPIIAFRPFTVNRNNYIFLQNNKHVTADVQMFDENNTGLKVYSLEDTTALQNIAMELHQVDLAEIMKVIPYASEIKGMLTAEAHYIQTEKTLQLAAGFRVDSLEYEKKLIGDISLGAVYLPGENKDHHLNAYLSHNGAEVMAVEGVYHAVENGRLNADVKLEHFPLKIANVFIPEGYAELSGNMDGGLTVKGNPKHPEFNGNLKFDSASVFVAQAGAFFRFDEEPIKIESNKLVFDNFDIYTQGKNPFTINGNVDFSDFSDMTTDLKLKAVDYQLLNAPRTKQSLVYGKVFVNFNSTVYGPLKALVMRGNIILQGNTDVTYVLKDSPLTVQDRLGDLVTFVNFNDTTQQAQAEAPILSLGGLDMLMTVQIDPAVKLKVDLSADRESRVELEGGGDLSLQYTPQGDLILSGRYTLVSGLLKYSLSFISKTFTIQNGSYVDWTGNVMNPTLNITALERSRISVTPQDNQAPRMVNFDVSVAIKDQLKDLDLVFNLEAPEDAAIQNQLSAMDAEERGKLAVTMLATGMYLGGGGSFSGGGNAVNSFLQQQIASLAGSALKKIDISVGIETNDGAQDGSGKQTDLSFRFARKFWNNRLSVIIGGKISTGENAQNTAQSFIDNVALEWRLDNTGTRYVKLFHDKNYESILEGEITETGIGLVLRKKMSLLKQLFIFRKPKNESKTDEKSGKNTK